MCNVSIRSESSIDLTHTFDDTTKFDTKKTDVIVLHTRRRNYPIKIVNFTRHSKTIQQMAKLPRVVDLTCYNVEAVRTLADYLCDVDVRNFRLSGSMLLDLLQLCRIFEIPGLREFLSVYVIENIEQGKDSPSAFVFNVTMVMSDWTLMCDDRVRQRLYAMAALLFPQIQSSSYLAKFPLPLMIHLLGRCDLRVKNELEVALIALKWLQIATFTLDDVQVLFSTIRTPFISAAERRKLDAKAIEMSFVPEVIDAYNAQLDSSRNSRCCIIKDHMRNEWKRCGIPADNDKRFTQSVNCIDLRLIIPRTSQMDKITYYEHQLFDCDFSEEHSPTAIATLGALKVDEYSNLREKVDEAGTAIGGATQSAVPKDVTAKLLPVGKKRSATTQTTRSSTAVGAKPSALSSTDAKVFFQDKVKGGGGTAGPTSSSTLKGDLCDSLLADAKPKTDGSGSPAR